LEARHKLEIENISGFAIKFADSRLWNEDLLTPDRPRDTAIQRISYFNVIKQVPTSGQIRITSLALVPQSPVQTHPINNSLTTMNAIQSNIFKVRRPPASREGANRTELRNRADREEQLKVELTRRQRQYELESYSFYSDLFVSRIASHAQNGHALLRRYNLRGLLQSVVGKLLMN
jgi:hypothetical protein